MGFIRGVIRGGMGLDIRYTGECMIVYGDCDESRFGELAMQSLYRLVFFEGVVNILYGRRASFVYVGLSVESTLLCWFYIVGSVIIRIVVYGDLW